VTALPFSLERSIFIGAPPALVFSFFQDSALFARWWGAGSSVDPRVGGEVVIRFPNAVVVRGAFLELDPPRKVVFTYGYDDPTKPIAPGGSTVTVTLQPQTHGTLVTLSHALATPEVRDTHVQGWRHQLGQFSAAVGTVLAGEDLHARVDRLLTAWSAPDAAQRRAILEALVTPEVRLRERYGALDGLEEVVIHLGVLQRFFPGQAPQRVGDAVECHGRVLFQSSGGGSWVLQLSGDGRVSDITSFARPGV
jgi:uncharacterized protein YndB with AHSA1/START domain